MKLTEKQHQEICKQFAMMRTNAHLLELLNLIKPLAFAGFKRTHNETASRLQLKSLTWYANTKLSAERYTTLSIQKKNGKLRTLHAPTGKLKNIQRCLNALLSCLFEPHEAATGFVANRSIKDNAIKHINKPYVYNIDLKDFFTSIEFRRILACLKLRPFNLIGTQEPLAFLIANLCCVSDPEQPNRAFLPQGAPTSPLLSNVVCQRLDKLLTGLAHRFGATYTRYADDITFSSYTNIYKSGSEFCRELDRIIADQRFTINPDKTRLQKTGYRQEVTGLTVNKQVNVSQPYLEEVRQLLYIWKKHGETVAAEKFWVKRQILTDVEKKPVLRNVLEGKLLYLKMVRGKDDALYQRYSKAFGELVGRETGTWTEFSIKQRVAKLTEIIELYKNGDIAKATELMEAYKTRQADYE